MVVDFWPVAVFWSYGAFLSISEMSFLEEENMKRTFDLSTLELEFISKHYYQRNLNLSGKSETHACGSSISKIRSNCWQHEVHLDKPMIAKSEGKGK